MKFLDKIKLGFYHAAYHRNLRYADKCKKTKNLAKFKKYVYQAEDAWKHVVLIQKKYKEKNG